MQKILDQVKETDTRLACVTALAAVGLYTVSLAAYSSLKSISKYAILPRCNLKQRYGGGAALITGATDGLGKEYAI
jgi:hypothetical protein